MRASRDSEYINRARASNAVRVSFRMLGGSIPSAIRKTTKASSAAPVYRTHEETTIPATRFIYLRRRLLHAQPAGDDVIRRRDGDEIQ